MPERCPSLPPVLRDIFQGVDLLLHAGDVGDLWVLDRLSAIAPTIAVHGNDDTAEARRELPYQQLVTIRGLRLLLCHSHHPDPDAERASRRDDAWRPKLDWRAGLGHGSGAVVAVFGHTHIPLAREHNGILLVNPGALASPNGVTRQRVQTVAILFVTRDGRAHVSHVDLARPTERYVPAIDWAAGFRAALDDVSCSILAPDLAEAVARLTPRLRTLGRIAFLRAARRCWSGELVTLTSADLLAAIDADQELPPPVRAELRAAFSDLGRGA